MRSLFCLSILISLFVTGCSQGPSTNPLSELIINESVLYPENEPPFIKIKREGKWEEISKIDDYPSKPEINADKTKLAFISPYEFEMAGDVWLYDALKDENRKIFSHDQAGEGSSASYIHWVDNEHMVILIGYTIGTISSNHTLYLLNIEDNKLQQLFQVENSQDIRNVKINNDKTISFDIATYNEESTEYHSEGSTLDFRDFIANE